MIGIVVVAAGAGTRLGRGEPKAFVEVVGRSILARSMDAVRGMADASPAGTDMGGVEIVVVVPAELVGVVAPHLGDLPHLVVAGGVTRQQSVAAGLSVLDPAVDVVLVHDAARAFTPAEVFERVVSAVRETGDGVVPGLPVTDTIKGVDADVVLETVDRSRLTAVQTPQGFPRALLDEAYARAGSDATDDAELVQQLGRTVRVVAGDPRSFKITTPHDLERAERLVAESAGRRIPGIRTGIGVDAHAFVSDEVEEVGLWLAGLHWPAERALAGHSDGDVVAHAICDALLGATGLGDLGSVFGTADPELDGAHGEVFLSRTVALLAAGGFSVGNVAVQLVGNRPRFAPRKAEAESLLSTLVGAPVTVSATTTDGLGFAGRGEGLTAIATALVVAD